MHEVTTHARLRPRQLPTRWFMSPPDRTRIPSLGWYVLNGGRLAELGRARRNTTFRIGRSEFEAHHAHLETDGPGGPINCEVGLYVVVSVPCGTRCMKKYTGARIRNSSPEPRRPTSPRLRRCPIVFIRAFMLRPSWEDSACPLSFQEPRYPSRGLAGWTYPKTWPNGAVVHPGPPSLGRLATWVEQPLSHGRC